MPEAGLTLHVGWGPRVLGLLVLAGVLAASLALGRSLPPLSWAVLGVFGAASLAATVSNFGERLHADDRGLRWENVLLGPLGLRRPKTAAWADVHSAVELDKKTIFLTVEGQRRWVLDAFDGLEELRRMFEEHGIPVETRARPRLRDFGRGPRDVPPS